MKNNMKIQRFNEYIAEKSMSEYNIEKGDMITYKGTTYIVDEVDDYVVKLYDIDDKNIQIELNSNMLKTAIIKKVN